MRGVLILIDERHYWFGLKRKIVTAWLVIAIAPAIPLLAVLIVLKFWELAWPVIILIAVVLCVVLFRERLARSWWRWR